MSRMSEIEEKLQRLSAQKEKAAIKRSEELEREQKERIQNNILARMNALRNGNVFDDQNFTADEYMLIETVKDASMLALDSEGHLCLATPKTNDESSETPSAEEEKESSLSKTDKIGEEHVEETADKSPPDDVKEDAQALPVDVPPAPIAVANSAKFVCLENLTIRDARIYMAIAENELNGMSAYAYSIEQSRGDAKEKILVSQCSKMPHDDAILYGAINALEHCLLPRLIAIQHVDIFAETRIANYLIDCSQSPPLDDNADAIPSTIIKKFRKTLENCRNSGVEISVSPAKSPCPMQYIADVVVKTEIDE